MRRRERLLPHIWISGPDPINHKLYTDCQRARAQAWYRGEEWHITEQEYIDIWRTDDRYLNKGRHSHNFCLRRLNYEGAWAVDNVEITERGIHYRECQQMRNGGMRNKKERYLAES